MTGEQPGRGPADRIAAGGLSSSPAIEVLDPGLLLTVQDLGRPGWGHLGVPESGAADGRSLALANRLVGNPTGSAALEATLLGPRLRAVRDVTLAIAGADLDAVVQHSARAFPVSVAALLAAGEELAFREAGGPGRGCRVYVAVAGGVDVPQVLGSRSTSLVGAFGGFDGRPLRSGDVLRAFDLEAMPTTHDAKTVEPTPLNAPVRVLAGPAALEPGGADRLATLLATRWTVALESDRRGLRLEPADGDGAGGFAALSIEPADRPSHGVVPGAIQVSPSGQPLVLMPDGGVTGGYPVIAVVIRADLALLGQLAPGAEVRFTGPR